MVLVYAKLSGGLGNQLFIIFSCIGTALRDNAEFVLDGSYDNSSSVHATYARKTYWESPIFLNLKNLMAKNYDITNCSVFNENNDYKINTIPNVKDCKKETLILVGYLQCLNFFNNYADKIASMLGIYELQSRQKERFPHILNMVTCCMHFRLGDYKKYEYKHPIMPLEYFKKSLCFLLEKLNNTKLCVLWVCHKPDKKYVKEEYISKLCVLFPDVKFEELPSSDNDYEELLLMSLCDHFIISNSTFSWWAAYFCLHENKIICYPSTWYGYIIKNSISNNQNKSRMFPKTWKKINFDINLKPVCKKFKIKVIQ